MKTSEERSPACTQVLGSLSRPGCPSFPRTSLRLSPSISRVSSLCTLSPLARLPCWKCWRDTKRRAHDSFSFLLLYHSHMSKEERLGERALRQFLFWAEEKKQRDNKREERIRRCRERRWKLLLHPGLSLPFRICSEGRSKKIVGKKEWSARRREKVKGMPPQLSYFDKNASASREERKRE